MNLTDFYYKKGFVPDRIYYLVNNKDLIENYSDQQQNKNTQQKAALIDKQEEAAFKKLVSDLVKEELQQTFDTLFQDLK